MRTLVLSFTLKDQNKQKIFNALAEVFTRHRDRVLLHGFMPRELLLQRDLDTDVVDALKMYWPQQINFNHDGIPLRKLMAQAAGALNAKVIIIGRVADGVREELDLYQAERIEVEYFQL